MFQRHTDGIRVGEHERPRSAGSRRRIRARTDRRVRLRPIRLPRPTLGRHVFGRAKRDTFHRQAATLRRLRRASQVRSRALSRSRATARPGRSSRWTVSDRGAESVLVVRLLERSADLPQNRNDARGRLGPERVDERLQADAVEQLHHVIQAAFLRRAEVVQINSIRRLQPCNGVGFALKALREELLPARRRTSRA